MVVPETPSGMPAVMITVSPGRMAPAARETSTACSNRASVLSFRSHSSGRTPQLRFSCRQTFRVRVAPMICVWGRNREIIRALVPLLVTVMMAEAERSLAVVTVAWPMAVVVSVPPIR